MQFDHNFFNSLGLGDLSDEEKATMTEKLAATVQNRVASRLSTELSPEELKEFDAKSEQGEDQGMEYLAQVYPNFPVLIQEEIERLKAELSQDAARIREIESQVKP